MPYAPRSRCVVGTCPEWATRRGRCDEHQTRGKPWATPSANGRELTGKERAAFREAVLRRDPVCRMCGNAPSTEADHIIPIGEGGSARDINNGQGLCGPCHDRKTREDARRRRVNRIATLRGTWERNRDA